MFSLSCSPNSQLFCDVNLLYVVAQHVQKAQGIGPSYPREPPKTIVSHEEGIKRPSIRKESENKRRWYEDRGCSADPALVVAVRTLAADTGPPLAIRSRSDFSMGRSFDLFTSLAFSARAAAAALLVVALLAFRALSGVGTVEEPSPRIDEAGEFSVDEEAARRHQSAAYSLPAG